MRRSALSLVFRTMKEVTIAKPSRWSMDSTMPMAGSKKRITLPTSAKPFASSWCKRSWPSCEEVGLK